MRRWFWSSVRQRALSCDWTGCVGDRARVDAHTARATMGESHIAGLLAGYRRDPVGMNFCIYSIMNVTNKFRLTTITVWGRLALLVPTLIVAGRWGGAPAIAAAQAGLGFVAMFAIFSSCGWRSGTAPRFSLGCPLSPGRSSPGHDIRAACGRADATPSAIHLDDLEDLFCRHGLSGHANDCMVLPGNPTASRPWCSELAPGSSGVARSGARLDLA